MLMDRFNTFAKAIALPTAGTGIFNIGDVINLQAIRDIGRGKPGLYLALLINAAITSNSAATVNFLLASDSQNPPHTDGVTENIHIQTAAIPKATLIAGYELIIPVPFESPVYAQYLSLQANILVGALTGGVLTAALVADPNAFKAYPAAVFA